MSDFYYVTKYALSLRGVLRVKLDVIGEYGYLRHDRANPDQYKIGKEAFLTWPEALADCELRLARKRKNLSKQLDRLAAVTFEKPKGSP